MINTLESRKKDFKNVIKNLDITPSMFKNAEEKYKNIAKFLNEHGLNLDISLQGSFAIGTAIRPYSNGKDKAYDIDAICLFKDNEMTPKEIRDSLVYTLNYSEVYNDKINECPKCFTLEYAKLGDYDFSIDLVPTVIDCDSDIGGGIVKEEYLKNVLKIASKDPVYDWYTINPKGYQKWFNDINARFALYGREQRMKKLFEENKQFYASVEEIPEYFNKSSLQEAVQILKRSRDVYFSKIRREKNKPASIILTTFTALVASECPTYIDSVELAFEVIKRFSQYLRNDPDFAVSPPIIKKGTKWEFYNPVNLKDNLLDSWNEEQDNSKFFFTWLEKAKNDLNSIIDTVDVNHIEILGNLLGNEVVDKVFKRDKVDKIKTGAKPYHE